MANFAPKTCGRVEPWRASTRPAEMMHNELIQHWPAYLQGGKLGSQKGPKAVIKMPFIAIVLLR